MMGSFDVGLMMMGIYSGLAEFGLVAIALFFGIKSLVLLLRRPGDIRRGRRSALVAIGLGLVVESWTIWFFAPWRFPNMAHLHLIPLPAFLVGGCAMALWGTVDSRRWSSTGRLMIVIAVATIATGGVLELQRWDRRRELLHHAGLLDREARGFQEAAEMQRRCVEHGRRGEPCERCRTNHASEYYLTESLKYAKLRAAQAKSYRWAADHGEEPSIVHSVD